MTLPRRRVVIGTAGHVDHGKTALVEALTGIDCDRWREEKDRGITIDLGFAHLRDGDLQLSFVDVPGHERFVGNALAGLGGVGFMMLVVAADEGVEAQTEEHLEICSLLDIPGAVAVLTKSDLVERELLELARLELEERLLSTPFAGCPVVAVSSHSGEGVEELRALLLERARADRSAEERERLPARLPIDRAFVLRGLGTLVTGTVQSGRIEIGQELELLPRQSRVRVRGIQVHGEERPQARAGERASLQLAGVERSELERGGQLAAPGSLAVTNRLLARARWLPSNRRALAGWTETTLHLMTGGQPASVRALEPAKLEPGAEGTVEIKLAAPLAATRDDRFILRRPAPVRTAGGGSILDPHWARPSHRRRVEVARDVAGEAPAALVAWIRERGLVGADLEVLERRLGLPERETRALLAELTGRGSVLKLPSGPGGAERWIAPGAYAALEARAEELLERHLHRNRLDDSMPKAALLDALLPPAARDLGDLYLGWLADREVIALRQDRVTLPGRGSGITAEEESFADRIVSAYERAGLTPPAPEELRREVSIQRPVFDGLTNHLVREGRLARLRDGLLVSNRALEELRRQVLDSEWETFSVPEFKERFGLTRKWAIPLLEHLDRQRVTRRQGDVRAVLRPRG